MLAPAPLKRDLVPSAATDREEEIRTHVFQAFWRDNELTDLGSGIHHGLVVDLGSGSHHHSSSDSVKGVRSETSSGGDSPTEKEGSQEVTLEGSDKDN